MSLQVLQEPTGAFIDTMISNVIKDIIMHWYFQQEIEAQNHPSEPVFISWFGYEETTCIDAVCHYSQTHLHSHDAGLVGPDVYVD